MSFDWLNIPGLSAGDSDVNSEHSADLPPPTVSFDFGPTATTIHNNRISQAAPLMTPTKENNPSASTSQLNGKIQQSQYQPEIANPYSNMSQGQKHANYRDPNASARQTTQASKSLSQDHIQQQNSMQDMNSHQKYQETPEDLNVPLSLSRSQLTREEARTYLRWYTFITLRTHGKLVRLTDVFRFLSNFNLTNVMRERIATIFRSCKNALNIGQFFAVLRLISKALIEGVIPSRKMILEKAPVPKPRPILNSDHESEVYEEVEEEEAQEPQHNHEHKVDFDSFASLLLTGKSTRKRIRRKIRNKISKNKRVRFSEQLTFQDAPSSTEQQDQPHDVENGDNEDDLSGSSLDFSLPMDQLLKRIAKKKNHNTALVSSLPDEKQETEEEKEVLEEMKDSLSHFKQIQTVDLASVAPTQLSSVMVNKANEGYTSIHVSEPPLQPLKPTSTGSANYLFRQHYNSEPAPDALEPSQFQEQPTLQPLKPTATGSANYLVRNHFPHQDLSSTEATNSSIGGLQPLRPTATGSGNHFMKQQSTQHLDTPAHLGIQSSQNMASPSQSPDIRVSSPNGHVGMASNMIAPQARVPLQQRMSPQVTPQTQQNGFFSGTSQSQNMLSAPNPASTYFQALLSSSPSPNSSNVNLSHLNNQPNIYQSAQSSPAPTAPTSQSRASYNNGYQYYSPLHTQPQYANQTQSQQPQPQTQQQDRLTHAQQPVNINYTQNMGTPTSHGFAYGNGVPITQSPRNGDILGDLHSLQQQVDALQNVYGRR